MLSFIYRNWPALILVCFLRYLTVSDFQVGSVIRNPEIAALVPTLLISIADPNEHTKTSLDLLLQVCFYALFVYFELFKFLPISVEIYI